MGLASVAIVVVGLAGVVGCFPNPDALRTSSSGTGGSTTSAGGATGGGGTAGTAGQTGAGGTGVGGTGVGGTGVGGTGVGGNGSGGGVGAGGRTGAGGTAGSLGGTSGGTGGTVVPGLVLTPDSTGWIAPNTNSLGLMGGWYGFSDGIGADGTTAGGACEMAGHPPGACSMLTSPSPTAVGFPNTGGKMCATGIAALVVNNAATGLPDYGGIYGASIGFDFNTAGGSTTKGSFNALDNGITGIQFDIDLVPANGLRIEFVTPGTDLGQGGPAYWGASPAYPASPVFIGTNRIYWADVIGPLGLGLDPTKLVSMDFSIPTQTLASDNFHFCISNVTLIRDSGPAGRTCNDQTFPVYCPGANGVPSNCWNAGVNCFGVTNCSGVYAACFGQAQTDFFDCTQNMCRHCSGAGPMACPGLGTVPPQCWPPNTACSTVVDCGGGAYESCSDPSLSVDCPTLTCN